MLALSVLLLLLLLPFVDKAVSIDDPLFIWAAQNIQKTPADPYGFSVNWYGTGLPMAMVTKNPPLASYYLAVVGALGGWREWLLHLALVVPALLTGVGTYLIAARLCAHPLLATLAGVLTPVFLVSSLTMMSDVWMLAFWVLAVHAWMLGLETRSHRALALAGLLVALSALSKYFGMTLIPLLALYAIVRERRVGAWALHLLIPVVILGGYHGITQAVYGRGLLLDAAVYATTYSELSPAKVYSGLAFAGACVASIVFFAPRLWSWKVVVAGLLVAGVLAPAIAATSTWGAFQMPADAAARWLLAVQVGFWGVAGIGLLTLAALDLRRRRDAGAALLFAWMIGTFVFATFVNWSTNARSLLPMLAPTGILIARGLETRAARGRRGAFPTTLVPLALGAALSLTVTWADCRLADTARVGAARIHARYGRGARPVLFQGHWGFQYYMERLGARAVDVKNPRFASGDIVAVPTTNTNLYRMEPEWSTLREVLDVPSTAWLTTMSLAVGAGFYADLFGPVPFAVGSVRPERFAIFEIRVKTSP